MAKKYNYQDNFDMLMLRHDYMSRIENPDPRWVKEFEPIVVQTSWIMFNKHRPKFAKIGYEIEDIINITNCYMLAYMSLYSLRRNEESLERVRHSYKKRFGFFPDTEYLDKKEKINMISFLRQRLQHASVICSRKIRNIIVDNEKVAAYAYTDESIPISDHLMYQDGESYGYRRVSKDELTKIKKTARANKTKDLVDEDGYPIVEIDIPNEGIKLDDYKDLFISSNNDAYHTDPEKQLMISFESEKLELYRNQFNDMDANDKKTQLKDFIQEYKGNKKYKTELKEAKRILGNM